MIKQLKIYPRYTGVIAVIRQLAKIMKKLWDTSMQLAVLLLANIIVETHNSLDTVNWISLVVILQQLATELETKTRIYITS